MNINNEVSSQWINSILTARISQLKRGAISNHHTCVSRQFPDGSRTIKYLTGDEGRVPIQYIFFNNSTEKIWHYDAETRSWYEQLDRAREAPWRGTFGFDSNGWFFMRDQQTLWVIDPHGMEFRSRVDVKGREAAVRVNCQGDCIYAKNGSLEWVPASQDGELWEARRSGKLTAVQSMRFSLSINGDFVSESPNGRIETHHADGSITVLTPQSGEFIEKEGFIELLNSGSQQAAVFVDASRVDKLPDTARVLRGRVTNDSDRAVLVGARDGDGLVKIFVVPARSSTGFLKNPTFVVDDPRYQVRILDGRALAPAIIPPHATIFKFGHQRLTITNESWGMVLLGWPIAGPDTIGGIADGPVPIALPPSPQL